MLMKMTRSLLYLLAPFFLLAESLHAQSDPWATIDTFRKSMEGVIWDLRGTSSLKHLRFDGDQIQALNDQDKPVASYGYSFLDPGIFRIQFKNGTSGWYFVSDDLRYITPVTIASWIKFSLVISVKDSTARTLRKFPEDIAGLKWEPSLAASAPFSFTWTGSKMELRDNSKEPPKIHALDAVIAGRNLIEVVDTNADILWFAFARYGSEAWVLKVRNVFGGLARGVPEKPDTPATPGLELPPSDMEVVRHIETLLAAQQRQTAFTLYREMVRRLDAKFGADSGQLKALKLRLGVRE